MIAAASPAVAPVIEVLDAAIERAMVAGAVGVLDRRAAALRADTSGDAAAQASRGRRAAMWEACAHDIAALLGPITPAQGSLALPPPAPQPTGAA